MRNKTKSVRGTRLMRLELEQLEGRIVPSAAPSGSAPLTTASGPGLPDVLGPLSATLAGLTKMEAGLIVEIAHSATSLAGAVSQQWAGGAPTLLARAEALLTPANSSSFLGHTADFVTLATALGVLSNSPEDPALFADLLRSLNAFFQPPAPSGSLAPSAASSGPVAAIAGTYSGMVLPAFFGTADPPQFPTAPRALTLTIRPDGSGSFALNPFSSLGSVSLNFAVTFVRDVGGTYTAGVPASPATNNLELNLLGLSRNSQGQLTAVALELFSTPTSGLVVFENLTLVRSA